MSEKFFIGIDQSSKKTGYAVLDENGKLINYGVESISGDTVVKRAYKLMTWFDKFHKMFIDGKIVVLGLEDIQGSFQNYKTVVTLSKILGVFEYCLFEKKVTYKVIPVGTWRKSCGIKGRKREEQKKNAISRVKEKYGVDAEEDAAEAICIAEHLYMDSGW